VEDPKKQALVDAIQKDLSKAYACDTVKPVCAPFSTLGAQMVEKLMPSDGSILVVSDLGLLVAVLRKYKAEQVTFIAHTAEQEKSAQEMSVSTMQIGYNDCIKALEKKLMGLKFDIVVANPPYGNLHLPIMKKCVESLSSDGVYLSVQPVRWLRDPLWNLKKSTDAKKMQEVLDGRLDSVDIIASDEATRIFSSGMARTKITMELGIFKVLNAGGNMPYDALSKRWKNIDISGFMDIVHRREDNFIQYDGTQKNFMPIATITGGDGTDGASTTIHKKYGYFADGKSVKCKSGDGLSIEQVFQLNRSVTHGRVNGTTIRAFSSAVEIKNFYDFIRLDAFRFFIYILTRDVHVPSKFLPFPKESDAFISPWTNKRFYTYHGIAKEQQAVIEETMKKFPLEDKNDTKYCHL
jgi:hypothetical protein